MQQNKENSINFLQVGDMIKCGHCYPDVFKAVEPCECVCHKNVWQEPTEGLIEPNKNWQQNKEQQNSDWREEFLMNTIYQEESGFQSFDETNEPTRWKTNWGKVEQFISSTIQSEREKSVKKRGTDIQSVLNMLDGDTDRKQIANFIREYLTSPTRATFGEEE